MSALEVLFPKKKIVTNLLQLERDCSSLDPCLLQKEVCLANKFMLPQGFGTSEDCVVTFLIGELEKSYSILFLIGLLPYLSGTAPRVITYIHKWSIIT